MNKMAFTLIEIMIVIVILGVIGILAVPRITGQQEVAALSEGVSILQVYYGAQKRYFLDHDVYTAACANLDVSVTPKNFAAPTCAAAVNPTDTLVSIARSGGPYAYTVTVALNGDYACASCHADLVRSLPK